MTEQWFERVFSSAIALNVFKNRLKSKGLANDGARTNHKSKAPVISHKVILEKGIRT